MQNSEPTVSKTPVLLHQIHNPTPDESILFEFTTKNYHFVFEGYPVWKAFVTYRDSNIWIESFFKIDISERVIYFSKTKTADDKKIIEQSILDLLVCDDIEIERKRIEDFFSTVPSNVIQAVSKFPDSHWEAIESIILIGPNLLSLINSNPALAYIIINSKKINPSIRLLNEAIVIKKMIITKQKEVLSKCGFPETNQMVKIVSKIDPTFITVNDLISLRNLLVIDTQLKERILNTLSFAKTINHNLLRLTIYNSPLFSLLSNKIIYELAASELFNEQLLKIKQLYLNYRRWQLPEPKINSLAGINKTFEKQLLAVEKKRQRENSFPPPPIEDNFNITAICQESDLVSWSKRQHNCIRSYASSVKSKQRYFYKIILDKEEATLELKLTKGQIRKGDLLGTANRSVSKELIEMVDDWFKENKSKKKNY